MEPMSAGNRVKRFKRFIYVICSNRVVAAFLGNRAVVRGSFSAAMLLSLVLFGVTSFLWMVGPQPGSHDWLWISSKGQFSDSHISTDHGRALP
jgi:hypothetical protein